MRQGQTTTPGTPSTTLWDNSADHVRLKTQETGPTVYIHIRFVRQYSQEQLRRLESTDL